MFITGLKILALLGFGTLWAGEIFALSYVWYHSTMESWQRTGWIVVLGIVLILHLLTLGVVLWQEFRK